jgi:hypothetical protein
VTDPSFEQAAAESDDVEVVDALPVPAGAPLIDDVPAPRVPVSSRVGLVVGAPVAVQAAAVAVTGVAAGAATVAGVRRARSWWTSTC